MKRGPGGQRATGGIPTAPGLALICRQTLTASQATFDTNSILGGNIPGTYKHLELVLYGAITEATTNDAINMQVNADTGANYDTVVFTATGTPASSGQGVIAQTSAPVANLPGSTAPAGCIGTTRLWLPNYADTTLRKGWRADAQLERGTASGDIIIINYGGNWRSTAAITRILLTPAGGSFAAGSSFSLYGVT